MDDNVTDKQSKCQGGTLYVVPTPIGNLKDITLRALEVLRSADVIACEDTRTSAKLLSHYDVHTPRVSYHEHNGEQARPKLLARLAAAESVALISDAGTPLISDPGFKLVRAAQEAGHRVEPLPGACAAITALSGCGLPSDHFTFAGFLPSKETARWAMLESLKHAPGTLVLYESPKRVIATLEAIEKTLGPREVVLARELTKRFEEILRMPVAEMIAQLKSRDSIKGEIVLLIAAPEKKVFDAAQLDAFLLAALETQGTKQAAAEVAAKTGAPKSELYQRALALKS